MSIIRSWSCKLDSRRGLLAAVPIFVLHSCVAPGDPVDESPDVTRDPEPVRIRRVAPGGQLLEAETVPEVVHTDKEWKAILTPLAYAVLRHAATELAFTGKYDKHWAEGLYLCAGCGTPLFHSNAKFNSRTGWPSFGKPAAVENIFTRSDGMREEVLCRRCGGHLGHVFPDGPDPTGLRYCINSAALKFSPAPPLLK